MPILFSQDSSEIHQLSIPHKTGELLTRVKAQKVLKSFDFRTFVGPSDWIRTSGLLNPIVAVSQKDWRFYGI